MSEALAGDVGPRSHESDHQCCSQRWHVWNWAENACGHLYRDLDSHLGDCAVASLPVAASEFGARPGSILIVCLVLNGLTSTREADWWVQIM